MQTNDLLDLANEFGNPLYVYDAEKIEFQQDLIKFSDFICLTA